tara:strand:- start:2089 stop:2841 length:753 start_codon:yes stop_codon:yes gene_type:complete
VKNSFFNKPISNVYSKPSTKSEISTQVLYGEKFKVISKKNNWIKIKTNYDNYTGFIKKGKFSRNHNPTHKVFLTKSIIFKKIKSKFIKTKKYLYFSSTIKNLENNMNYIRFDQNKWIKKKDLKNIEFIDKNYIKLLKLFLNTKYFWGGKSVDGIDCSALIQLFFKFNGIFFPRDTKDQIKYCKKKSRKVFGSGDIIFWKGHVGLCLNKKDFIHAYGPKKKVIIMNINKTISLISKTANLKVKKISNIEKY